MTSNVMNESVTITKPCQYRIFFDSKSPRKRKKKQHTIIRHISNLPRPNFPPQSRQQRRNMSLNNLFLTIKGIFRKCRRQSFSLSSMFFTSCKTHSDVAIHGRSDTDENGTFFHDFAFLFFVSINDEWVARVDTNIHDTHKYPPRHLGL